MREEIKMGFGSPASSSAFVRAIHFVQSSLKELLFCLMAFSMVGWRPSSASAAQPQVTVRPVVGAVTSSSATIFLRTDRKANVQIAYLPLEYLGSSPSYSKKVRANWADDYTVQIQLDGLEPAMTYSYQAVINNVDYQLPHSPQFTTAPTDGSQRDFRFAIFSDLSARPVDAPAYQAAVEASPAFALQIGDFDHFDPAHPLRRSITIENWRSMRRRVLKNSEAGAQFAQYPAPRIPLYHTWDHHDYGANNADGTASWKDLASQAFRECYVTPPLPNSDQGIWYSFRFAQAEFFVLDLRSQRDQNNNPDGPEKSMLNGGEIPNGQLDWLQAGLLQSEASWKFIISPSVLNPNSKQDDSWYQFQYEQNQLLDFIQETGLAV